MRISENAQYSARCLAGGKRPVTSAVDRRRRREGVLRRARGLRRSRSTRRPVSWAVLAARELYEGRYHRPAGTRIRDATVLSTATGNPGRYLDRVI